MSIETGTSNLSLVQLTDAAKAEVMRLLSEEETPAGIGLRLGIKGGGCSGLMYVLDFTEEREGDTVLALDGFSVYLDRKSTIYLSGITLDFQSGLEGKGFVFQNPMASNTCGCGESFSL
jgi:iron-sulfur cluster assembly protein